MTITENEGTTATEATEPKRKFDVDYTLEIMEGDLPPVGHGGGGSGSRTSPLEMKLDELKGREDAHGKWVLIGKYGKATAAGAAANVLRQRHGRNANAEGFEFAYRKLPTDDGATINGLFVKFDPNKVVPGALEQHQADEKARLERLAEAKAAREAEAAAKDGETTPAPDASTVPTSDDEKIAAAKAKAQAAAQKAAKK